MDVNRDPEVADLLKRSGLGAPDVERLQQLADDDTVASVLCRAGTTPLHESRAVGQHSESEDARSPRTGRRRVAAVVAAVFVAVSLYIDGFHGAGYDTAAEASVINNRADVIGNLDDITEEGPSSGQLRAQAAVFGNVAPSGGGPWPFYVVDTRLGLKVRTTGDREGYQIGSVGDGAIVWAECRAMTEFDPLTGYDVGPRWLRVRWPNTELTATFFASSPGDLHTGYVYEGYVVPDGHNGDIPEC